MHRMIRSFCLSFCLQSMQTHQENACHKGQSISHWPIRLRWGTKKPGTLTCTTCIACKALHSLSSSSITLPQGCADTACCAVGRTSGTPYYSPTETVLLSMDSKQCELASCICLQHAVCTVYAVLTCIHVARSISKQPHIATQNSTKEDPLLAETTLLDCQQPKNKLVS